MRKLLVTCECGQKMQVPRSAIGKMGMCPTCGTTTRISSSNTTPLSDRKRGSAGMASARTGSWDNAGPQPTEEAKQRFGKAVDHYYAQRYAEALAIFDALAKEFPSNPDIDHGRQQCLRAMQRPTLGPPQSGVGGGQRLLAQGELDRETVRRIVLDKLLNGATDAIQLQAADLACKYFILDDAEDAKEDEDLDSHDGTTDDERDDYELDDRIQRFPSEDVK